MEKQFMSFFIDDAIYGVNILGIREINNALNFTPVPLARPHIVGLLNLRGQIVTVLDTGTPLGYAKRELSETSSLLIMKTSLELSLIARQNGITTHEDQVGFLVDRVGDVLSCDESDIHPVPAHMDGVSSRYLEGVLKRDDLLMGIINVPELLKYE